MIQEVLVLLACISNKGCTNATQLYYDSNPKIEQIIKKNERIMLRQLAPEVIAVAPYILVWGTGRGNFRINRNFLISVNRETTVLVYYKTF